MEKTPESTRERVKKFLDELKEKGPDLSMVGKTVVKLTTIHEELDEPLSESRKLRKLKYELSKEMIENKRDDKLNKKNIQNLFRRFNTFIYNLIFKKIF